MYKRLLEKQKLTPVGISTVNSEYEKKKKETWLVYVLWLFTGGIGGHRYYLGDYWYAVGMTLTLGGFGLWTLVDLFLVGKRTETRNEQIESRIIEEVIKVESLNK